MIKAILFDCFGVVCLDDFAGLYSHFGGDIESDHQFIHDVFFSVSKGEEVSAAETFSKHLGVDVEEWRRVARDKKELNMSLLEYTEELKKKYKIGMLSNVGQKGLRFHIDYDTVAPYFDVIVESAKIGFAKPEARAYEIAADKLGMRLDEIVFTDDRIQYVEGAQHVGMKAILFENTEQFKRELEKIL